MTWTELADHQRSAARKLAGKGSGSYPRASCSRSYYAVYALIAGKSPARMILTHGTNPGHSQLAAIVDQMGGIPKPEIRLAIRRLLKARIISDYMPQLEVSAGDAKQRLRDCELASDKLANKEMNKVQVIESVIKHLEGVGHSFSFEVVEGGVRKEDEWWFVPVLAKSASGEIPPREFLITTYANIEDEIEQEHGFNLLLIPAA